MEMNIWFQSSVNFRCSNVNEDLKSIKDLSWKYLLGGGEKKLKKESFWTVFVTVLTDPLDLCFCFFLIVLTVTFFPFFQSMMQP